MAGRNFPGQNPTQTDETPEAIPTEAAPPTRPESSEGDEDEEDRVEFGGEVESISAGLWVIDGRSVIVTPDTEIEGGPVVGDSRSAPLEGRMEIRWPSISSGTTDANGHPIDRGFRPG